jgi:hypothetical protein
MAGADPAAPREDDHVERSRELEDLTRGLYAATARGDDGWFDRHLADDACCVVIGTAPDEWWEDRGAALDAIRAQMQAVGDGLALVAGDVRAYRAGDVGWVADRPTLRLGTTAVPCRHTSVFVRESGEWRIVQHHFSIGVPNEAVLGEEARRLDPGRGGSGPA